MCMDECDLDVIQFASLQDFVVVLRRTCLESGYSLAASIWHEIMACKSDLGSMFTFAHVSSGSS